MDEFDHQSFLSKRFAGQILYLKIKLKNIFNKGDCFLVGMIS